MEGDVSNTNERTDGAAGVSAGSLITCEVCGCEAEADAAEDLGWQVKPPVCPDCLHWSVIDLNDLSEGRENEGKEADGDSAALEAQLRWFTGTTRYYRHWTRALVYTNGIQFLAESCRAYWLIDAIALDQEVAQKDGALREFQLWELTVHDDRSALLTCSRDCGDVAFQRAITFTDFPLRSIKLYVEGQVLLLPSEH